MKRFCLLLLIPLLFVACRHHDSPSNNQVSVVTSIFPLYDIAQHIAGERLAVTYVVPVGANPHHYEPLPTTAVELQHAKLFIGIHREFDGWITDLLSDKTRIEFILSREESLYPNPHIWLTPRGGKRIAGDVAHLLATIDPNNRDYYFDNLSIYERELSKLDSTLFFLFNRAACKQFIQWHPAWDYLARDYHLTIIATIEHGHGVEPSVKQFMQLVDEAKEKQVKVIVTGLHARSNAAKMLTREIGGVLLKLDPIGDPRVDARASYIKMIYYNAVHLSSALNEAAEKNIN